MSYVWFNKVLEALGKRLNYESISNLYGNSFAKDAQDVISSQNPLHKIEHKNNMAALFAAGSVAATVVKKVESKEEMEAELGDLSWAGL